MEDGGLSRVSASVVVALILGLMSFNAGFKLAMIGTVHAAPSTITQTNSGLDHFDSLTTGNTSYWYIGGDAQDYGAPHAYSEGSRGLDLSVQAIIPGSHIGYYAVSPNTGATAYHAVIALPYTTIPDNIFNVEMWVQSADQAWISGVGCAADVTTSGYYWDVEYGQGPNVGGGNPIITTLWASPLNTGPLTQDCTIVTNGQNFLKVYLGGNVVYQSSSLTLNISSPFNSYLEVQTSSASAMRNGTFNYYYSMLGENVTVTNAPVGGTVKIVNSSNSVVFASATVSSTGTAILPIGGYRLPLTANIEVYDPLNNLVASTSSALPIWGGDTYTLSVGSATSQTARA